MSPEVIAALVGLFGIATGATLQYFLTRHYESEKERRQNLASTSSELLLSIHNLAACQANLADEKEAKTRFESAKSHFLIHGSAPTITALSDWLDRYGKLDSEESRDAFASVLHRMRSDIVGKESAVSNSDIYKLLFGKKK